MIRLDIKTTRENEFVDITAKVRDALISQENTDGILLVFCPHTTAGITINENADPDVLRDLTWKSARLIERGDPGFRHMEGNSDAHLKSSFYGASETVIVEKGEIQLGRWQSIYFAEFDGPRSRQVFLKFIPSLAGK